MTLLNRYKFIFPVFILFLSSVVQADNLGRLFTSADERQKLEKIRHIQEIPESKEVIKVEVIDPVLPEKEVVYRDSIILRGLVHRNDGKNTAWINDSNTFDGDLDSHFIQVPDDSITSDQVTIILPDDSSQVELKVGDAFTPDPIERDMIEIEDN